MSNKTIVAAFDHEHEAEQARRTLLHAGFSYAAVVVHSGTLRTGSALDGQSTVQEDHGGIGGWFRSLFNINEDDTDAALYAEAARRGHFVLSVHVNDDAEAARARQLLDQHGTVDLDARARQWREDGWLGADAPTGQAAAAAGATAVMPGDLTAAAAGATAAMPGAAMPGTAGLREGGSARAESADDRLGAGEFGAGGAYAGSLASSEARTTIPVVQETLQVGKRTVQRGGLRVTARLVEAPVQQTVLLRDEQVHIERRPVDRPATQADFAALQAGASVDLLETVEEAVVSKQVRVVEEIELARQVTEREHVVSDMVRHTEVQVERLGGDAASTSTSEAATGPAAGDPAVARSKAAPR